MARSISIVILLTIMVAGFALRYSWFVMYGGHLPDYLTWANSHYMGGISRQYLAGIDVLREGLPWTNVRPPGYSLTLLIFTWLGADGSQELRLYQMAADCLTCVPLFYIVYRLTGSSPAALLAALFYALTPLFSWNAVTLLAEAIAPLLMASLLAQLLAARDGTWWRWLALGFVAGFAFLVRSDVLLFAGFVLIWWWFTSRQRAPIIAFVVALTLPSALWFSYSHLRTGHYGTASAGGYAMWSGLGQTPSSHGYFVNDVRALERLKERGLTQQHPEANAYWWGEYWKAWREHPGHVVNAILWRVTTIPFSQTLPTGPKTLGEAMAYYIATLGLLVLVLSLASLLFWRQWAAAFIVSLPVAYAVLALAPVYFEPRYIRYLAISYILAPVVALAFVPRRNFIYAALAIVFLIDLARGLPTLPS